VKYETSGHLHDIALQSDAIFPHYVNSVGVCRPTGTSRSMINYILHWVPNIPSFFSARCNIYIFQIQIQIPIPIYRALRSRCMRARGKGSSPARVEGSSRAMLATARPSCFYSIPLPWPSSPFENQTHKLQVGCRMNPFCIFQQPQKHSFAHTLLLGPFHGAIAVPSVTRCRCRRCRGHRCVGGVRQYR